MAVVLTAFFWLAFVRANSPALSGLLAVRALALLSFLLAAARCACLQLAVTSHLSIICYRAEWFDHPALSGHYIEENFDYQQNAVFSKFFVGSFLLCVV